MTAAVVPFPGKPLVAVLSEPGRHSVMLAKIGSASGEAQCSFTSLSAAIEAARDGAAHCGWRFVGVVAADGALVLPYRSRDGARRAPEGPDAA